MTITTSCASGCFEANLAIVARRARRPHVRQRERRRPRSAGVIAIKPSGVPYDELAAGRRSSSSTSRAATSSTASTRPSSDTPTHLVLYRALRRDVGGIVHTHSPFATAWAQAGREIPCFGTTHADHFRGAGPGDARARRRDEIAGRLRARDRRRDRRDVRPASGSTRSSRRPCSSPRTARSRGAPTPEQAVENAIALEAVAASARCTRCAAGRTSRRSTPSCSSGTSAQARAGRVLRPAAVKALRLHGAGDLRLHDEPDAGAARRRGARARHRRRALRLRPALVPRGRDRRRRARAAARARARVRRAWSSPGPRAGERVALDPASRAARCAPCLRRARAPLPRPAASPATARPTARCARSSPGRSGSPTAARTSLSDARRALLEPLGVALHALDLGARRGPGRPPASSAAGRSGCCSCRLLRAAGVDRRSSRPTRSPHRVAAAAALGATRAGARRLGACRPDERPRRRVRGGGRRRRARRRDRRRSGPAARRPRRHPRRRPHVASRASTARRKGLTLALCRRMRPPTSRARSGSPSRAARRARRRSSASRYALDEWRRGVREPASSAAASRSSSSPARGGVSGRYARRDRLRHRVGPRRARRLRRRARARRRPSTPYANGVIDERLPAPHDDVELEPDWALQDPEDYVRTLEDAVPAVLAETGVDPADVIGVGIDFTACTMLPTTRRRHAALPARRPARASRTRG